MKTNPTRRAGRYHDHAVYRSAQRLVAVAQENRAHRMRTRRRRTLAHHALGLFCGILIGITLASVPWRSAPLPASSPAPDLPATNEAAGAVSALHPRLTTDRPRMAVPPRHASPPSAPTASRRASVNTEAFKATSGDRQASSATPGHAAVPSPSVSAESSPPATALLLHAAPEIHVNAFLRSTTAPDMAVEFILRRHPEGGAEALAGVVRFNRAAANWVVGQQKGPVIELRETSVVWTRPGLPEVGVGRVFVLNIPTDPHSREIVGTWSWGSQRGTLTLRPGRLP